MIRLEDFAAVRVICLGDLMLDRFVHGAVHRISPESPVPVLSIRRSSATAGGAGNVALNIAALGGRCTLLGVAGRDAAAAELGPMLESGGRVQAVLLDEPGRPTTVKTRFVTQGQQLLRVDEETTSAIGEDTVRRLLEALAARIAGHQVLVLSDYAKGVLTPALIAGAIAVARAHHVPVVVDPKTADIARYAGATVMTPNAKEVEMATGLEPTEDDALAVAAGERILAAVQVESLLITRAHRGMTLVSRTAEPIHLRAQTRDVFDVVGAGDTVVASLALAVGAGVPLAAAAHLSNVAAGIVVGKRGTASVSPVELARELARLAGEGRDTGPHKLLGQAEAQALGAVWRREGETVAWVQGRFDRLTPADLRLFERARREADRLVVALAPDEGEAAAAPFAMPAGDRATVLAALPAVDALVLDAATDTAAAVALRSALAPAVWVVDGATPTGGPAAEALQRAGVRVVRADTAASAGQRATGPAAPVDAKGPAA